MYWHKLLPNSTLMGKFQLLQFFNESLIDNSWYVCWSWEEVSVSVQRIFVVKRGKGPIIGIKNGEYSVQ